MLDGEQGLDGRVSPPCGDAILVEDLDLVRRGARLLVLLRPRHLKLAQIEESQ